MMYRSAILIISSLMIFGCEEVELEPIAIGGSYTIAISLDEPADVYIDIENRYDTVVNTIDLGHLPKGPHHTTWDRLDRDGNELLPGLYYLRLSLNGEKYTKTHAVYHLEPTGL